MKRFRFFPQIEMTDCGPACIQMISYHYGKNLSLNEIKGKIDISRIGVTVGDIKRACDSIGFDTVVAQGNVNQLAKTPLPSILHWRNNHFVVLYKIKQHKDGSDTFYVADPSQGKLQLDSDNFKAYWMRGNSPGTVICLKPNHEFTTSHNRGTTRLSSFFTLIRDIRAEYLKFQKRLFLSGVLLALSVILSWCVPYIYGQLFDIGISKGRFDIIIALILAQFSMFMGYVISGGMSSIVLSKINFRVSVSFLSKLLSKIVRLPMKHFDTKLCSDYILRIDNYYTLENFITRKIIDYIFAALNIIVFLALLGFYCKECLVIYVLFSAISMTYSFSKIAELRTLNYAKYTEMTYNRNIVGEIIYGMPDIKANNAQDACASIWENTQHKVNNLSFQSNLLDNKINIICSGINKFRDLAAFVICGYMMIYNDLSLGALMGVSYVIGQLSSPTNQLFQINQDYMRAKIAAQRINEIHSKNSENTIDDCGEFKHEDSIVFQNVWFKYPGSYSKNIISDLDMTIAKGDTIAIVGDSGSGKTTFIKLLLGFYQPTKGQIKIDGISLAEIDLGAWRKNCGVVLQEGKIFSGSVLFNIAMDLQNCDMERAVECAKLACIDEEIRRLPGGYTAPLGNSGIELSCGQKQRILLARAFYKRPSILLFDEATSSLDTINERRIMDNIYRTFSDSTIIIVAHRLSTVKRADMIFYLSEGKIIESGTHSDLVASKGAYYNLISNQLEISN